MHLDFLIILLYYLLVLKYIPNKRNGQSIYFDPKWLRKIFLSMIIQFLYNNANLDEFLNGTKVKF